MEISEVFNWLCTRYVQAVDGRQKSMGLQYMTAETHDLAESIVKRFSIDYVYVLMGWETHDGILIGVYLSEEAAERAKESDEGDYLFYSVSKQKINP